MKEKPLTKLERELLADLYEVEELFLRGKLTGGTIRSHVMYRMATRRGRTRPAPVHGLAKSDSAFAGVFTRTVNRLVSRKLVKKRSIKGDFAGLPYQWGFARHGRRDKDIFLTDKGREPARQLALEREADQAVSGELAPRPEELPPPPSGPGRFAISYVYTPSRKPGVKVTARHTVNMHGFKVTYVYVKEI